MQTAQLNISSTMLRRSYRRFDSSLYCISYRVYRSVPGGLLRRYTNAVCMSWHNVTTDNQDKTVGRSITLSDFFLCPVMAYPIVTARHPKTIQSWTKKTIIAAMPVNKNALLRYKTIDRCLRNRYRRWTLDDLVEACSDALNEMEGITRVFQ